MRDQGPFVSRRQHQEAEQEDGEEQAKRGCSVGDMDFNRLNFEKMFQKLYLKNNLTMFMLWEKRIGKCVTPSIPYFKSLRPGYFKESSNKKENHL